VAAAVVLHQGCGSPPDPFPPADTGAIGVNATSSTPIDSIVVRLDDLTQGYLANPCTLQAVVAGTHKLTVIDSAGARTDTMVTVQRDRISAAVVRLTRIGPFVGNEAPDFAVQDIDGRGFGLAAHRGRVVFLSFFEYT
jgi:hypothetical protein